MSKILEYLQEIYAKDAERVYQAIDKHAKTLKRLKRTAETPYWYKYSELYCVYPDGVLYDKSLSPLGNLVIHIEHIKKLGCNAVHILPFFNSPMIDRGFDVSDYYRVRKNLGSLQDLLKVKKAADNAGMRIFIDLVFNHVSDQHIWFKKAQQGNEKYRNYFIYSEKPPIYLGKFHKRSAVWAKYKVNNKIMAINMAFPERAGDIPHWRQGHDGNWYYHTYYPQQIDLNWFNPEVFIEMAKVMLYWASFGFNFRLDAIPFIGKQAYKLTDINNQYAYLITAALKCLSEKINPECAFIVETYESLKTVINYFGNSNRIQANLSYNFHLSTKIWISLIKQDVSFIWQIMFKQKNIPKHAEWLNFLRNHDELSLAYLNEDLLKEIKNSIGKYGKMFREGHGISGRTFSLLRRNKKRFLMAYFLLASFPGGIMIPYGDEIGYKNIPLKNLLPIEKSDTRNINRGLLLAKELHGGKVSSLFENLSSIVKQRRHLREYLNVWPERISAPKTIYAASYKLGSSELLIYVNLADKPQLVIFDLTEFHLLEHVNSVKLKNNAVLLGPYAGVWLQK